MKTPLRTLSVAFVVLACSVALAAQAAPKEAAQSTAVQTMATILSGLNHFPSDAEKQTLQGLIDAESTTAHERTVAQALLNVNHTPPAADKPKLQAIVDDASAPAGVKTLAGVLVNLNHTPSAEEKEALQQLAQ
jgi:hypothetical protein